MIGRRLLPALLIHIALAAFAATTAAQTSLVAPTLAPTQAYNTFHPREAAYFSWTSVPGAQTYILEMSRNPSFPPDPALTFSFDNIPQTTYSTAIGFEGNFSARVYAVAADGTRSAPSNVISFSVLLNNPIGPPPRLVSPINGETVTLPVTLKWAHVPNPQVLGYDLQVATDPGFTRIETPGLDPATSTATLTASQLTFPEFTLGSLTSGTKFWRVFSVQGITSFPTPVSDATAAVTAPSASGTFTVSAAPARVVSIDVLKNALYSGESTFLDFQLSADAPASGLVVNFTSSDPNALPVPATTTVRQFAAEPDAMLPLQAGQVTTPTPVTVTATLGSSSATFALTVLPTTLKSLDANPPAVSGGNAQGAVLVNLNGAAPPGGAVVSLSSDSPAAVPPATVTAPAGAFSVSAPITTSTVTQVTVATITASYNGVSTQAQIIVAPALPPATLTIDPTSKISSDPGSATGKVTVASISAYDQSFQLTSSDPAVATVPNFMTVPAGSQQIGFFVHAHPVSAPTVVTISASGGGVSRSAQFPVYPAGTTPSLSTVTLNASAVMGGTSLLGTVNLNSIAPAGGLVVTLSDDSPAVTVPASVTVPANAITADFTVTTSTVSAETIATISGTLGTTQSTTLKVTPGPPGPFLSSVTVNAGSVIGGGSATGTVTLSAAAPAGGAVVPLLTDTSAASVPPSVTVSAGATSATFTVTTSSVTAPIRVAIFGSFGDRMQGTSMNVTVPVVGPMLSGVTIDPITVAGPGSATGTVTLNAPAPPGGADVTVTAMTTIALVLSPMAVPGPPGTTTTFEAGAFDTRTIVVTVPAGATSATFPVTAFPIAAPTVTTISAVYHGVQRNAVFTVTPDTPTLASLSFNPTSVIGGVSATGTVTLSIAAPAGGALVTLSDNSIAATVPASVTVPAGATSANFTITTSSVAVSTPVTATASFGGASRTAALTVNPAPPTPSAPSLLSPADQATVAQPILFDWTDAANAVAYEIQIATSGNFTAPLTLSQNVTVSQATITGLPAQRLFWRVRGINAAGVAGPFSAARRFTAQAAPAAASLSAVSVNPTSVVGGNAASGTVTLTSAAPSGGLVVSLSSSNTAIATVPASVTVAAGATSASFAVATTSVVSSTAITITGTGGGATRTATLTVTPVPPPASLSSITLSPSTVTGGASATGTATLTSAAPSGGLVVNLSSSNTAIASLPASVTIAAGATSASFTITTSSVTSSTAITITGSGGGTIRTATLTVSPQPTSAVLTLTATGRAGESVSSSPAGINVNVGTIGSASFAPGTSITLTVSNGRSAIWSGGCSSAGAKVKSCTFTINAATSVTANVQ